MVSEEIEFNHAAEAVGIEAMETDMGEYILQLAGEKPSTSSCRPSTRPSSKSPGFRGKLPGVAYTEDVDTLIQIGRGCCGRNSWKRTSASPASTWPSPKPAPWSWWNEGNGRLSTTTPRVHVAITGIEKVVESRPRPPLLSLLTRSATGRTSPPMWNMISGPPPMGELDGPEGVHLVLLDNGRTQPYADEHLRKTLRCIPLRRLHRTHCRSIPISAAMPAARPTPGPWAKSFRPPAGPQGPPPLPPPPASARLRGMPGTHSHSRPADPPAVEGSQCSARFRRWYPGDGAQGLTD